MYAHDPSIASSSSTATTSSSQSPKPDLKGCWIGRRLIWYQKDGPDRLIATTKVVIDGKTRFVGFMIDLEGNYPFAWPVSFVHTAESLVQTFGALKQVKARDPVFKGALIKALYQMRQRGELLPVELDDHGCEVPFPLSVSKASVKTPEVENMGEEPLVKDSSELKNIFGPTPMYSKKFGERQVCLVFIEGLDASLKKAEAYEIKEGEVRHQAKSTWFKSWTCDRLAEAKWTAGEVKDSPELLTHLSERTS